MGTKKTDKEFLWLKVLHLLEDLEDNNITHIVEYNSDTQDFNVAYELGYLRALEIMADRFTEIERELINV